MHIWLKHYGPYDPPGCEPTMASYACVVHLGILVILCRIVLPGMSHDAVVDRGAEEKHLRDIMSATSKPERPKNTIIGTKQNKPFGVVISQGRLVFEYVC